MPRAKVWADEFEEGIKAFGFSPENIFRHSDADYETFDHKLGQAFLKAK